jgi:hypothetical protein
MAKLNNRLVWLFKRLSRVYPMEIPYRAGSVAMALLRRAGLFDATRVPPQTQQRYGTAWVALPETLDRAALVAAADRLVAGQLEVLGSPVPFDQGHPVWTADPRTGTQIPLDLGEFIDFRHIRGVDIKFLWEVNRHLWLVTVAQAHAATGEPRYLDAIGRWLSSWLDDNPYPLGPNWSSPVEHGIRLINWSLVWHLIGGDESPLFASPEGTGLKTRWMRAVYQHMHFIRSTYSRYSSADNHLIGEIAGMYVGGRTWPLWPSCPAWTAEAKAMLEAEAAKQFAEDGVNREQAFCYHIFSLEFLLAALACGHADGDRFSDAFVARVQAAVEFAGACLDVSGHPPFYGDSDGGHVFSLGYDSGFAPYRSLVTLGSGLLGDGSPDLGPDEASAWVLAAIRAETPPQGDIDLARRDFSTGGFTILGRNLGQPDEIRVLFDVGPLGYNRISGHGHADALSVLLSVAGRPFLIDAGTYCYNAAPELRRYFRGTSAHNTLIVDGQDQSVYGSSFLWLRDVETRVEHCTLGDRQDRVVASHTGYLRLSDPVRHRRTVVFDKPGGVLSILDTIESKAPHRVELRWHLAPECRVRRSGDAFVIERDNIVLRVVLTAPGLDVDLVEASDQAPDGWVSRRFYQREPSRLLRASGVLAPGAEITTTIGFLELGHSNERSADEARNAATERDV